MAKEKLNLAAVALYVNPNRIDATAFDGSKFGTWKLHFVDISEGVDKVRYFDRYSTTGRSFRDLRFRAQWERDRKDKGVYAQRLTIESSDIERVEEAEAILAILKRAAKVANNFPVHPVTFGQYVALMCKGLGIKKFILPGEQKTGRFWGDLEGFYHNVHKVDDFLSRVIDSKIEATYEKEQACKTCGGFHADPNDHCIPIYPH